MDIRAGQLPNDIMLPADHKMFQRDSPQQLSQQHQQQQQTNQYQHLASQYQRQNNQYHQPQPTSECAFTPTPTPTQPPSTRPQNATSFLQKQANQHHYQHLLSELNNNNNNNQHHASQHNLHLSSNTTSHLNNHLHTLHHTHTMPLQPNLLSSTISSAQLAGSTNTGTTPPASYYQANFQHHQRQPHQHHNFNNHNHLHLHQQQQYNPNSSDYSSSTYHIYDQISDLKIIKQQRLEKRRQVAQRRKVLLLGLLAILLVGGLAFLLLSALFSAGAASNSPRISHHHQSQSAYEQSLQQASQQVIPQIVTSQQQHQQQQHQQQQQQQQQQQRDEQLLNDGLLAARDWPAAPPGGPQTRLTTGDHFDATKMRHLSVITQPQLSPVCSNHGTLVAIAGSPAPLCRCEPAFYGPWCEHPVAVGVANQPPRQSAQVPAQLPHQPALSEAQRCAAERCNGLGRCTPDGSCRCAPGFGGHACQLVDRCVGVAGDAPICSNQGTCQPDPLNGEQLVCACNFGFAGALCDQQDPLTWPRLLNCSSHGQFDPLSRKCQCDTGFGGVDCSEERCEPAQGQQVPDCGPNGLLDCRQNRCICQEGFSGDKCQVARCSAQCLRNGQCVDGTCLCRAGFYGKHCGLNGCPNDCSQGRGRCVRAAPASAGSGPNSLPEPEWRCQCPAGFAGADCGQPIEKQCDDGIDNDKDGLVDCADSECCSDRACQNSTLCMKSPDPLDILMRKQPPPPTSSFFHRMQFLIEKFSSQQYTSAKDFNESRASVVRGRVTYLKQGVVGVRVSVAGQVSLGMTLTRDGGHFDLMVNGGGAISLEFRREPFAARQMALRVPANEIVLVDQVELELDSARPAASGSADQQQQSQQDTHKSSINNLLGDTATCLAHDHRLMRPQVSASPRLARRSSPSSAVALAAGSGTRVFRESGIVQQSVLLPASGDSPSSPGGVSLVYSSARANEFLSSIWVQLTPAETTLGGGQLLDELRLVHLRISVEGNLFEQTFEPAANLSFTWGWNRRNVYRQKSFGQSAALVQVGYEYLDCQQVVWTSRKLWVAGHELAVSELAGQWSLSIHHRYNPRDHILQLGDGLSLDLKTERPRQVRSLLGDGHQRPTTCPFCDQAEPQRLLRPQALAVAPDGSLYLGDFNLVRKLQVGPPGSRQQVLGASTVLELPAAHVPKHYALALNPAEPQRLYLADPERAQVFQVRQEAVGGGAAGELIAVAGSGARCAPDDADNCGDGGQATLARLIEPRAIAFDLDNRMYIADGPNVRMVDAQGRIFTLLGGYSSAVGAVDKQADRRWTCQGGAIQAHLFTPTQPLALAFDPVDNTLHLLDDNQVFKVTRDRRVLLVAGRSSQCGAGAGKAAGVAGKASETELRFAQSIAFGPQGDLYVVEDDQHDQLASRVLRVSPAEDSIHLFAGADSPAESQQQQHQTTPTKATDFRFGSLAGLAVDQTGRVLVLDRRQLRLLAVDFDLPQVSGEPGAPSDYELVSPHQPDELLVFNRFGLHLATRGRQPGAPNKFTFAYNVNTSLGQLASIQFASGNKISLFREGPHQQAARLVETALGGQCRLELGRHGQVQSIGLASSSSNSNATQLAYLSDGGLLRQARDLGSGDQFEFAYDELGRARSLTHLSRGGPPLECRRQLAAKHQPAACNSYLVADQ